MTKITMYRYLGTNGIIESPIHLEDIYYTRFYKLIADQGKVLVNGDARRQIVNANEEEVANWKEVKA